LLSPSSSVYLHSPTWGLAATPVFLLTEKIFGVQASSRCSL
jgi:hypothetical protein